MTKVNYKTNFSLGSKFNHWTFIGFPKNKNNKRTLWECQCDCGYIKIMAAYTVVKGESKQCKNCAYKARKSHRINLINGTRKTPTGKNYYTDYKIGAVFNNWTILDTNVFIKQHHRWKCQCSCGKIGFPRAIAVVSGLSKQCVSCAKKNRKNMKHPRGEAAARAIYSRYKHSGTLKHGDFNLTYDEFKNLTQLNCFYCGKVPSQIHNGKKGTNGPFIYNGVDRINNLIGYQLDNCVPCCSQCNWSKCDYTVNEFLEWIHRIYYHQLNKRLNNENKYFWTRMCNLVWAGNSKSHQSPD